MTGVLSKEQTLEALKICKLFILPKKKGNGTGAFQQNCEKSKIYKKYSKKGIA